MSKPALLSLILLPVLAAAVVADEPDAAGIEFFEKKIRPLFVQHCYECHSESKKVKGGLQLDSRSGWTKGGDSGPAIVPGNLDESLLIEAVRYDGDFQMPPKGKLPGSAIRDLEEWVKRGAPDPRTGKPAASAATTIDLEAGRQFWSYRPIARPEVPAVQHAAWPRSDIDRFILAALEAKNLKPSPEADRTTLVRRLYFDLIGLPPTPEQIDAFVADESPNAYEELVDRLLASPQFGERWGRHWLDVVRYAESLTLRGFVFKEAWRYRDYVIDTFNADRPFDQFLREQVAGDLLPAGSLEDRQRQVIATTFLVLGNNNLEEQDKQQLVMDVVDEQLDVIGRGLLAQTITCARCHDHKFDPIPTKDYYALAGILKNSRSLEHANVSKWLEVPLPVEPEREAVYKAHDETVADLQGKIKSLKQALAKADAAKGQTGPAVLAAADLPGVIVDDSQAKKVGNWKASQFNKRYIGDGYIHDEDREKGQKTLTFLPELPKAGRYEVRLAYNGGESRSATVPVTVFSADGEKTITVNQKDVPPIDGRFISLGQFRFELNGQGFVIVSNEDTQGHVIADAVQFLPIEDAATSDAKAVAKASPADSQSGDEIKQLEKQLKDLQASGPKRPMAMTVLEEKDIADTYIHVRGSVHNKGETVPRGFLQVATPAEAPQVSAKQSGRKELAEWMTSPDNPLPARVMANRVWHWLMGAGLVRTTDNFGTTGERPSHPELLDHLATRFMDSRWSTKQLIREIVCSQTYRQVSATSPAGQAADPENRLLWRMNRRRLDAECLRDAILSADRTLVLDQGGPSYPDDLAADYGFVYTGLRRSVYAPVFRNALPELFEAFDFADPSLVSGARTTSTVAPQALFLMNHPFVIEHARTAAKRLQTDVTSDGERIRLAYRRILGREPTDGERDVALRFLMTGDDTALPQLVQSLFASIDFRYVR